jgi:hypothetical protein
MDSVPSVVMEVTFPVAGGKEGLKCHTDLNTSFSLQSANAILTKQ